VHQTRNGSGLFQSIVSSSRPTVAVLLEMGTGLFARFERPCSSRHPLIAEVGGQSAQYPMRNCNSDAAPEKENFALSKLGGPMKPFAWFEATVPSVGIPKRPVSSLPFLFSS